MKRGWKQIPIAAVSWINSTEYKTGSWRSFRPIVDYEKCIKCMQCWVYCPDLAIKWNGEEINVDYDYCKGCGICSEECPVGAIKMVKEV